MKIATLLAIAIANVSAWDVEYGTMSDQDACKLHQGGAEIANAVYEFCANPNIMAPSPYPQHGLGYDGVFVRIVAFCTPAQLVPTGFCEDQFFDICRNVDSDGNNHKSKTFGRDGCQLFEIQSKYF